MVNNNKEIAGNRQWLRVPQAVIYSGLSRSYIYELLKEGKIKSKLIRKAGNISGVRLIHHTEIDNYLNSLPNESVGESL